MNFPSNPTHRAFWRALAILSLLVVAGIPLLPVTPAGAATPPSAAIGAAPFRGEVD